jgi:hypothetical protein
MWSSRRIFACRIQKVLINASRPLTHVDVDIEMKRLNDTKQFSKALAMFDEVQRREIPQDRAVVQALKACTAVKDLKRGVNIHSKLSNRSKNDAYIQPTLINFYSQFKLSSLVVVSL